MELLAHGVFRILEQGVTFNDIAELNKVLERTNRVFFTDSVRNLLLPKTMSM